MSFTPEEAYNIAIQYLKGENIKIIYSKESKKIANGESYYSPVNNEIKIPSSEVALNSKEIYHLSTVFHECVHSTMKALKREIEQSEEGYAFEELVAEMGATMLMKKVEFNTERVSIVLASKQVCYLSCWKSKITSEEKNLRKAQTLAKEAVEYILNRGGKL